jgi:regulator of nucleoside diphosphate kinase
MRPNIIVSSVDIERLETMLDALPLSQAELRHGLLDELGRAELVEPAEIPANVATMNSQLRFSLDEPAEEFCLTLAYPKDMQADGRQVSVLSPVGSALIGLASGDSIGWSRPDGSTFHLTLHEVMYQPERAGHFHR